MGNSTTIPYNHLLDDDPASKTKNENLIINTLIYCKAEGMADNTIKSIHHILKQLSKKINLANPTEVKDYIANATKEKTNEPLSNATKNKYCFSYDQVCQANKIEWKKPFYKIAEGTPLIPTTENVNKIIGASTKRFATIFTILAEIGAEGQELHNTPRNKIDLEQGIISITGTKGHGSGNYKLKSATAEMLRQYIKDSPQEYPFPKPKIMAQIWQTVRNRLADNLKQPELKNIPMKNLRNYSGAKLYYSLPDPIAVMRHLRHKKLETTMHYIRGITINGEEEWICKTAKTIEEATALIEQGFTKADEIDGIKLYRKRK